MDYEVPADVDNILLNILLEKKKVKQLNQTKQNTKPNNNLKYTYESSHSQSKDSLCKDKLLEEEINNTNLKNINDISIDIKCNDCKSRKILELSGYYVCRDCGLYNDCIIDSGQEWRYYGADDSKGNDQARCDIPTNELLPKTSIGGLVGFGTKENNTSKRLRNMNYWNAIPYRESSLRETFNNITIMSQNSGISQCIIDEATYMYKKVTDIKSSRRTKKEAMKAGCIMLACKLKGVPRNCNEIATIFKLKNNKIFRKSVKSFEEIWNTIKLNENNIEAAFRKSRSRNGEENINELETKQDLKQTSHKLYSSSDCSDSDDSSSESDDSSSDSDDSEQDLENPARKVFSNYYNNDDDEKDLKRKTTKNIKTIKTTKTTKNIKQTFEDNINNINNINNSYIPDTTEVIKELSFNIKNSIDVKPLIEKTITITNPNPNPNPIIDKNLQECITKLHRFSCILGFNEKVFESCRIILTHVETEKYLDKHTPLSRTSAVIYYIIERLKININKHQILQTCEVSDVTINKCYQKLMKFKAELATIKIMN